MKPYRTITIRECGEPLIPIPQDAFAFFDPPPYMAMGAPYGSASPWMLREGVVKALLEAQKNLAIQRRGWKIRIFDAYRPNAVPSFMVEREFILRARAAGFNHDSLTPTQRNHLAELVYKYWSIPSDDPLTPPPHSTGAAIDCTLEDETGQEIDMGSPIDEGIPPATPDYFATAKKPEKRQAHANRVLLQSLMQAQGFQQHENEWWHFSLGDQLWAWTERQKNPGSEAIARYGRADLISK